LKKILLLSDTHDYIDKRILSYVQKVDEVWHAGDIGNLDVTDQIEELKTLRAVYGNVDGKDARVSFPEFEQFYCEQVSVLMTHIGGYPGRYTLKIKELLSKSTPKLFICGHSHILKVMQDKKYKLLHMNPGAAGIKGFHKIRTMLRFEINGDEVQNLEVIELGRRVL
jgi:putative phosphoesterase